MGSGVPDNVHETGVWPIGPRAFPVVAVEAGQVERTRRNDLVTGSTRVFVPYTPPECIFLGWLGASQNHS